jgi:phage gp45-like
MELAMRVLRLVFQKGIVTFAQDSVEVLGDPTLTELHQTLVHLEHYGFIKSCASPGSPSSTWLRAA